MLKSISKYFLAFLLVFCGVQLSAQWERVKLPAFANVKGVFSHKNNLYLFNEEGLFRSIDSGLTWQRKSVRFDIERMWADKDTLYALLVPRSYYDENRVAYGEVLHLKSVDNGDNWREVFLRPKNVTPYTDISGYSKTTVFDGVTYTIERFATEFSNLKKRNCDTCAWIKLSNSYSTNLTQIKNSLFSTSDFEKYPYKLYRLNNGVFVPVVDSVGTIGLWAEKADTLFVTYLNAYRSLGDITIISIDSGKTWKPSPPQYKFPKLDVSYYGKNVVNKVGDFFYVPNNYPQDVYRSKDLIKWDTLSKDTSTKNWNLKYANGKTIIDKSEYKGYKTSIDGGLSWNPVITYDYLNDTRELEGIAYYPDNDGSLHISPDNLICVRKDYVDSFRRGLTSTNLDNNWRLRTYANSKNIFKYQDNQYLLRKQSGDGSRYFLYRLLDSNDTKMEFVREIKNSFYGYPTAYLFHNDTLFAFTADPRTLFVFFSVDLGKNWNDLKIPNFELPYGYSTPDKISDWILLSGAVSKDLRNWKKITQYNSDNSKRIDIYGDYYYYFDGTTGSLDRINLKTDTKTSLMTDKVLGSAKAESFTLGEGKIWIYSGGSVYQSNLDSFRWTRVFQSPTYGTKNYLYYKEGYIWIQNVSSYRVKTTFDTTTAFTYRAKVSELTRYGSGGLVFWDRNKNSKRDTFEIPLRGVIIKGKDVFTTTTKDGQYLINTPSENDTIRPILSGRFIASLPPYHIISFLDTARNFALQTAEYEDLAVSLATPSVFRPGFSTPMILTVENRGLRTQNATLKLILDKNTSYQNSLPLATKVNDTLTWELGLMNIDELRNVKVNFYTAATTALNTPVTFIAKVTPIEQDSFKENNTAILSTVVVSSYDPNDKLVEPKSYTVDNLVKGKSLDYTIRFQNTGNYPASFVGIEDTLGDFFDLSTFKFISSSHPCTYEYKGKGIIKFTFNGINLPDSISDEIGSHGFVKYSITPKTTLKKGDNVLNTAFIYFDYNKAIITPTSKLAITAPTAIWQSKDFTGKLKVYPNPTQNAFTFEIDNPNFKEGNLSIYDLAGRLILTKNVFNKTEALSVKNLSEGEYICVIQASDKALYVSKFIKIK